MILGCNTAIGDRFSFQGKSYVVAKELPQTTNDLFLAIQECHEVHGPEELMVKTKDNLAGLIDCGTIHYEKPVVVKEVKDHPDKIMQKDDFYNCMELLRNLRVPRDRFSNILDIEEISLAKRRLYYKYFPGHSLIDKKWGEEFSSERIEEIIDFVRNLLDTLEYLIAANVFYGDLKPTNIVERTGCTETTDIWPHQYTIIDPDSLQTIDQQRKKNCTMATERYMSPEQAKINKTRNGKHISATTDYYSLGSLTLKMLEDKIKEDLGNPWMGTLRSIIQSQVDGRFFPQSIETILLSHLRFYPKTIRDVVAGLFKLLARLVKANPHDRPQNKQQALRILNGFRD